MIYLSQRDPRWKNQRMGMSTLTLGGYGCTTTCIAMLSDYFGNLKLPSELASNVNNYTREGLILWKNLNHQFSRMRFVWREYGEAPKAIANALLDKDKAVILQVDSGKHWVVALRLPNMLEKVLHKNDYWILDPWDGKKKWAKSAYRNVTGAAYFERVK